MNDYAIGRRGEDIAISVDLKETTSGSYGLKLQDLKDGARKAAKQGHDFILRVKFYGKLASSLPDDADYVVMKTSTFNALLKQHDVKVYVRSIVQ